MRRWCWTEYKENVTVVLIVMESKHRTRDDYWFYNTIIWPGESAKLNPLCKKKTWNIIWCSIRVKLILESTHKMMNDGWQQNNNLTLKKKNTHAHTRNRGMWKKQKKRRLGKLIDGKAKVHYNGNRTKNSDDNLTGESSE